MGARPLRRAIQRYIEDPLADEVLRQGEMVPGSTVMVERDPSDEEDSPLKLSIVAPKKPSKKAAKGAPEPEKIAVGAKPKDEGGDAPAPAEELPSPKTGDPRAEDKPPS
jgi:ATP-dependent Clp protease ATP-binding subunit ClpC